MALNVLLCFTVLSKLVPCVLAQVQHFYSNPALAPPTLVVETHNRSLTDAGYIFMTPFQDAQPSPLIFRSDGTLIWDGRAYVDGLQGHDLTVCDYNETSNLCFMYGVQENGYARGYGLVLDQTYTQVLNVTSGNGESGLDQHEFFVKENGTTVLATIYKQIPFDAATSAPGNTALENVTWLQVGIFQRIELATNNVLFEWQSSDFVPVSASYVLPGTTDISGDGLSAGTAWDYFHINSVDMFENGDYLVSARHAKTVYRINGTDGSIVWQLNGMTSDFTQDFTFDFQHNARVRNENGSTVVISVYDNGSDDLPPSTGTSKPGYEQYSAGKVLSVDTSANTSTLLEWYISPDKQLSNSQGDLQYLPNGNKFMGMGDLPFAVEFTDNSTGNASVVYYAHLENDNNTDTFSSYRNFKFEWIAQPAAPPDLFVYAQNCSTSPVFYASWNGATEVNSWRFQTSNESTGPFSTVAAIRKSGFETHTSVAAGDFSLFTIVEARGAFGELLGSSSVVQTFVPATSIANCTSTSCGPTLNYTSAATLACPVTRSTRKHHKTSPGYGYPFTA
ncbi:hypothetical protein MMC26_003856 [Xylographa opegraphella]|nr:hypothetical protein [Xylographa opegraphella]